MRVDFKPGIYEEKRYINSLFEVGTVQEGQKQLLECSLLKI